MTSKDKLICIVAACLTVLLVSVAWAVSWGYVSSWRTVTEAGYVEEPTQSTTITGTHWVQQGKR